VNGGERLGRESGGMLLNLLPFFRGEGRGMVEQRAHRVNIGREFGFRFGDG
jgi:hypothetical protein